MLELLPYSWILTLNWFVIYWILGGVFFAIVAISRTMKLRKARFSSLFTLTSLFAAFGAALAGLHYGHGQIEGCLAEAEDYFDSLAAVYGCGVLELFATAGLGFIGLLIIGSFLMYICRPKNDSWIDSNEGVVDDIKISWESAEL